MQKYKFYQTVFLNQYKNRPLSNRYRLLKTSIKPDQTSYGDLLLSVYKMCNMDTAFNWRFTVYLRKTSQILCLHYSVVFPASIENNIWYFSRNHIEMRSCSIVTTPVYRGEVWSLDCIVLYTTWYFDFTGEVVNRCRVMAQDNFITSCLLKNEASEAQETGTAIFCWWRHSQPVWTEVESRRKVEDS